MVISANAYTNSNCENLYFCENANDMIRKSKTCYNKGKFGHNKSDSLFIKLCLEFNHNNIEQLEDLVNEFLDVFENLNNAPKYGRKGKNLISYEGHFRLFLHHKGIYFEDKDVINKLKQNETNFDFNFDSAKRYACFYAPTDYRKIDVVVANAILNSLNNINCHSKSMLSKFFHVNVSSLIVNSEFSNEKELKYHYICECGRELWLENRKGKYAFYCRVGHFHPAQMVFVKSPNSLNFLFNNEIKK